MFLLVFNVLCNAIASENLFESRNKSTIVLVVNSQNDIPALSKKEVIDIYMGRLKTFPNGRSVVPFDYPAGSEQKQLFYQMLVGKDERKITAYWSRLLFSGRATPPLEIEPESKMIEMVGSQMNALAYIYKGKVTPEMKIVYTF